MSYLLLNLYGQLLVLLLGLPLIYGLLGRLWLVAAGACLLFALAFIPVAMVLHARKVEISDAEGAVQNQSKRR